MKLTKEERAILRFAKNCHRLPKTPKWRLEMRMNKMETSLKKRGTFLYVI